MNRLSKTALMHVGFRLSLLQSTWFEGGMQSIGLAYCLIPGLRVLYPDPEEMQQAVRRYEHPFNTHPFLVGFIAGALLRMEEQKRSTDDISCFSANAMGLLGAFGDAFFRSAVPSFVTVIACLAAILGGPLCGCITLLVLFNGVHLAVRLGGVSIGYREGCDVLLSVARWLNADRTRRIKLMAALLGGVLLVAVATTFGTHAPVCGQLLTASAGCALGGLLLTKWSASQPYAIPLTIFVLLLIEVAI
jgi:mannose/fructose/N-acetylgalactosamine-specific phosphotransferase system component IID